MPSRNNHINDNLLERMRHLQYWKGKLKSAAFIAGGVGILIAGDYLYSQTLILIPSWAGWLCMATTVIGVLLWAWMTRRLESGSGLFIYVILGIFGGLILIASGLLLVLGSNRLVHRSDTYERRVLIIDKKRTHNRHGNNYYLIFYFLDDGKTYSWAGGYAHFQRFWLGDTCNVVLYDGLWGYPVIREVKLTGRKLPKKPPLSSFQVPPAPWDNP